MLPEKSLIEVLDAFASSDPTPGGGSASALTGALGASLLAMVAGLSKTKTGTPEERVALDAARTEILRAREELVALIDRDAAAYDLVVAAYKRPKSTEAEKAARTEAIQAALRLATEVPVATVRACASVLSSAGAVAQYGNPSARSDLAVGLNNLMLGVQGALFNVEINIGSLKDQTVVNEITEQLRALQRAMSETVHAVYQSAGLVELMMQVGKRVGGHSGQMEAEMSQEERRAQAVTALLGQLGSPEARQALEALARSGDGTITKFAANALGKFGSSS
jgi:formiminotetrahydrofolate cyclodeaminase